jgi:uncharacterized membrane protein
MLNQAAFANSIAILTGALYILFYLLSIFAPQFFRHLFNAQFLGADVASLFPKEISFGYFVQTLVILVITASIFGYAWAWLYNQLAR